ncbi:tumor necrosis factor receptor superfamily member 1A [Betta splendens]|uniref:Tumor necrosis factor receptor superfamily member 1A n=1 Tax=Betta splendens TaxID=158456 RepID=A0A6P7N2D9_BETSP|nr:tumor necrosis factor receptor superfamily member 1A [Betta splendens]
MNFVSAFPLMLAILSRGHSLITAIGEAPGTCFKMCPAGFHKSGECSDPSDGAARYKCERCGSNSFTEKENYTPECERCHPCGSYQEVIKPCTSSSNVKCDCKRGYYNKNTNSSGSEMDCRACNSSRVPPLDTPGYHDYIRKCKPCQSSECLKKPACRGRECEATTSAPPSSTAPTSTTSRTSAVKNPIQPVALNGGHVSWLVWLAVTFAAVSGLLLLRRLFGAPESCLYWRIQKAVTRCKDDPKLNEQPSHQDNASTTLTINPCEETPAKTLSQSLSPSEDPAPTRVLLPSNEARAAKQDETSKDWPAIVLYAIIKEVPLRRWKEFLRLLSVADEQLERVELEAGLGPGSMERQYQMLRLWSQRASASLDDVFAALHYMDLSRRAELLEESLESLPWRSDTKQGVTA